MTTNNGDNKNSKTRTDSKVNNQEFRKRVGRNIKYYLDKKSETQRWLASKTGATAAQVTKWIKGEYMPSPTNMRRIAEFLDVSLSDIYEGPYNTQITTVSEPGKNYPGTGSNAGYDTEMIEMELKLINMRIDTIATQNISPENEYVQETKRRIKSLLKAG